MKRALALLILLATAVYAAEPPIYYLLWFDTEDYVDPVADNAALRIAQELSNRGVKATFKIVGEKARVLEQRGRLDVLRALSAHDIGYHSEFHSMHPTPAEYLADMGLLDGAAEFARREGEGFRLLRRIFGFTPSCYGQPGSSWAPQANLALREWGVPVYLDEGIQVGLADQPVWYGGLLYIYEMGPNTIGADLNDPSKLDTAKRQFDERVAALRRQGGGVIQTMYHPTEFETTEFWDAVNFRHGANPERADWQRPPHRTPQSAEQAYRIMLDFVDYVRRTPGVEIITAREAPARFQPRDAAPAMATARKLAESLDTHDGYSAADLVLTLLALPPRHVDGPLLRAATTYSATEIARPAFERAKRDAADFIGRENRLPDAVWIGAQRISLADFAATLAADEGGPVVRVRRGKLDLESHVAHDAAKAFSWVIHPEGFAPEKLLDLARLQAWTLKPARLR